MSTTSATPPGATPFDPTGLIPPITTLGELNEWERLNILKAREWALSKWALARIDPLDDIYVRRLHRMMFNQTWEWAGVYRKKDLNIGCHFTEINQRMPVLLGNVRHWIDNKVFDADEIALRFHHRLVGQIHAFTNGNGRHARMIADVLVSNLGRSVFTWGPPESDLMTPGAIRDAYLAALRALDADDTNVQPLLAFARS